MNVEWRGTARGLLHGALALARTAEPRSAVARRAVAGDAALAAVFLLVSLIEVAGHRQSGGVRFDLVPAMPAKGEFDPRVKLLLLPGARVGWHAWAAAAATSVPLAARRAFPLATFWIILAAISATSHYTTLATFVAVVFAAYNAVVRSRFRGPALISLAVAAAAVMAAFPDTSPPIPARATPLAMFIPIAIVGNAVRVWRRRAGDSQDRLRHLAAEHEEATRRALEMERSRIASELHDVVTHNVSVMVVQAGAARRVLADAPDDARQAMLAVESSGRAAMTELRHLLGLLAAWDGAAAATPSGPAAPSRPPRPFRPGLPRRPSQHCRPRRTGQHRRGPEPAARARPVALAHRPGRGGRAAR